MYSSKGFGISELGDIEIIEHEGIYHLFHLILPNHDYIAHAVSPDGFLWRRVRNALFIGEPGSWDDDMLWTMDVTRDPDAPHLWKMFYTGISRKEHGLIQRIGLARSEDLYHWQKDTSGSYPLSIEGPHYERSIQEGRSWVSCRDPFYYTEKDLRLLLVNARVPTGPVARRGCVGVAKEIGQDRFEWLEPLFFPRMYDDIEVPSLYLIDGTYYLLGNIKEDIKVHYWYADSLFGPYRAFSDNVLLPKGNYAAKIIEQGESLLLWNFFDTPARGKPVRILPPPVEVCSAIDGQLHLRSYRGFSQNIVGSHHQGDYLPLHPILENPSATREVLPAALRLFSFSGYETFLFDRPILNLRLSFKLSMEGLGKTGVVLRSDREGNGYYFSLDLNHGLAQSRVWGSNTTDYDKESSFLYTDLQHGNFSLNDELCYSVTVIAFGGYFELSIEDRVILRFVDTTYMEHGLFGFYVESAGIDLSEIAIEELRGPEEEDHNLF